MAQQIIPNDVLVTGQLQASTLIPSAACINDSHVASGAGIQATKLQRQHSPSHRQKTGSDVASQSEDIAYIYGATGTIVAFKVTIATAPTGGDKAFTVDLQRSTGGGAFATVLSGTVSISSSSSNRTTYSGTLSGTSLVAGDILRVIVATSGSTGSQGQGLIATAILREDPA